jgi:hypothetical protein
MTPAERQDRAEHWRFIERVEVFLRTICSDETKARGEW